VVVSGEGSIEGYSLQKDLDGMDTGRRTMHTTMQGTTVTLIFGRNIKNGKKIKGDSKICKCMSHTRIYKA